MQVLGTSLWKILLNFHFHSVAFHYDKERGLEGTLCVTCVLTWFNSGTIG